MDELSEKGSTKKAEVVYWEILVITNSYISQRQTITQTCIVSLSSSHTQPPSLCKVCLLSRVGNSKQIVKRNFVA